MAMAMGSWSLCKTLNGGSLSSLLFPLSSPLHKTMRMIMPSSLSSMPRPSLDDVERLSWGKPSKTKIGSRAVPHRLSAEERKMYELAKKKGYLVRHIHSRKYPLSNTFRNYCDAVEWPCVRIDQGPIVDIVVVDLTTLRLEEGALVSLLGVLRGEVDLLHSVNRVDSDILNGSEVDPGNGMIDPPDNDDDSGAEDSEISSTILRLHTTRAKSKLLCQTVLDCCKSYMATSKKPLSNN